MRNSEIDDHETEIYIHCHYICLALIQAFTNLTRSDPSSFSCPRMSLALLLISSSVSTSNC